MFTRLFRPFVLFSPDEDVAASPDVEAPTVDQPDVTADVTPEAPAPETTDVDSTTDAPESDAESFTDIDVTTLTEAEQGRYKEMQAAFTQKTQALAERHAELDSAVSFVTDLVSDDPTDEQTETQEAVFRTLAKRLGYEIDGDEVTSDDTPDEPESEEEGAEFRDPRLDPIIAEREAAAAEKAAADHEAHLDTVETGIVDAITALAKADGTELSEEEIDTIFDSVLALAPDGDGPNVKAAYARFTKAADARHARYVASKSSVLAPSGGAAGDKPDLKTPQGRIAHAARSIEAAQRS